MDAAAVRLTLIVLGLASLLAQPSLAADVAVTLGAGDHFVVKDNTGAIERLNVEEATGNISRNGALFVHTSGSNSTFVGVGAGTTAASGNDNSAFGNAALNATTTASYNSAFGTLALSSATGNLNSAFGRKALTANSVGYRTRPSEPTPSRQTSMETGTPRSVRVRLRPTLAGVPTPPSGTGR